MPKQSIASLSKKIGDEVQRRLTYGSTNRPRPVHGEYNTDYSIEWAEFLRDVAREKITYQWVKSSNKYKLIKQSTTPRFELSHNVVVAKGAAMATTHKFGNCSEMANLALVLLCDAYKKHTTGSSKKPPFQFQVLGLDPLNNEDGLDHALVKLTLSGRTALCDPWIGYYQEISAFPTHAELNDYFEKLLVKRHPAFEHNIVTHLNTRCVFLTVNTWEGIDILLNAYHKQVAQYHNLDDTIGAKYKDGARKRFLEPIKSKLSDFKIYPVIRLLSELLTLIDPHLQAGKKELLPHLDDLRLQHFILLSTMSSLAAETSENYKNRDNDPRFRKEYSRHPEHEFDKFKRLKKHITSKIYLCTLIVTLFEMLVGYKKMYPQNESLRAINNILKRYQADIITLATHMLRINHPFDSINDKKEGEKGLLYYAVNDAVVNKNTDSMGLLGLLVAIGLDVKNNTDLDLIGEKPEHAAYLLQSIDRFASHGLVGKDVPSTMVLFTDRRKTDNDNVLVDENHHAFCRIS